MTLKKINRQWILTAGNTASIHQSIQSALKAALELDPSLSGYSADQNLVRCPDTSILACGSFFEAQAVADFCNAAGDIHEIAESIGAQWIY